MVARGDQHSRRHHIVPKFYLRRFAKDDRLIAVDVKTRKTLTNVRVDQVAIVRDAYRPDGTVVPDHFDIENEISELERHFARALRQLGGSFPPDPRTRALVADFVVFQLIRRPEKRTVDGEDRWGDWLLMLGLLLNDPDDPGRRKMLADSELLEEREILRAAINERRWVLFEVPEAGTNEFITSDAPVYLTSENGADRSTHADADTVYLPLDRRHVLAMRRDATIDEERIAASTKYVTYLNQMTARNAIRFVYAHPDCHRGLVGNAVRGDDYLRIAARQRGRHE